MNRSLIAFLLIIMFKFAVSQQKQEISPVATFHYTQEEINNMDNKYIERVNFYFNGSYILTDNSNGKLEEFIQQKCNGNMFDVTYFEKARQKTYRNEIMYEDFKGIILTLFSWDEIDAKYAEIEKNINN